MTENQRQDISHTHTNTDIQPKILEIKYLIARGEKTSKNGWITVGNSWLVNWNIELENLPQYSAKEDERDGKSKWEA